MSKGEKMLIDLGYVKVVDNEPYFESVNDRDIYIEFNLNKTVSIADYRVSIKEIQAIHQCCVDYGWIKDEALINGTETIGYAEQSGLASAT